MQNPRPQRGDVFWVKIPLDHTVGSEQQSKRRPWLIVSTNALHVLPIVIGVPLSLRTHKANRQFRIAIPPSHFIVESGQAVETESRIALTEQIRTISVERLEFPRIARVTDTALASVEAGIAFCLEIG